MSDTVDSFLDSVLNEDKKKKTDPIDSFLNNTLGPPPGALAPPPRQDLTQGPFNPGVSQSQPDDIDVLLNHTLGFPEREPQLTPSNFMAYGEQLDKYLKGGLNLDLNTILKSNSQDSL